LIVPNARSSSGPGSRTGGAFFNEVMAFNRDVSVMAARALRPRTMLDAMAGTGARSLRIALESGSGAAITANDRDRQAFECVLANIELHPDSGVEAANEDLRCLLARRAFDLVDLDPFGSPVHFIPSAAQGVKRRGIIAITATDTAPLAGTYPKKCYRRYGARSARSPFGHESGLRILIGHAVREAAKEDRGARPVLSFFSDHFFRAYLRMSEGGSEADACLGRLGYVDYDAGTGERSVSDAAGPHSIGPMWLGPLHDPELLSSMEASPGLHKPERCARSLELWRNELNVPFFYDNDEIASLLKTSPRRMESVLEALNGAGRASRTHFSPTGFKTDLPLRDVLAAYQDAQ